MRRTVVFCLLLAPAVAAAQPALPDRSYGVDAVGHTLGPPMDETHHNQPSVVQGALLLAGNGVHSLYDIQDPLRPERLSGFESPHHAGEAESHQVAFLRDVDGTVYALMISGRGVDVFDLTDVTDPRLVSAVELEGIDYGDNTEAVWGVAWQGDTIYAGGTNTGLHVIDATDPADPTLVRRMPTTELGGVDAGPLFALGDLLVVTTPKNRAGIATVDLSEPRSPALLDSVLPETDSYIGGFYGRHAFLLTPYRPYDVTSDPRDIRRLASVETPDSEYVSFGDGHLFLGALRPNPGVIKYDLRADVTAPAMVQRVEGRTHVLNGLFTDDQFSIPIGNLVVLSDDESDLGSILAVHDARRDTVPPAVAWTSPADGATGRALDAAIGLSFTDQIDLRSVTSETLIVRPVGGEPLRGRVSHQQTLLSFAPTSPLAPDTTYEVVLPAGGVTDLVGNPIAEEHRLVFSTGADVRAPDCVIEPLTPVVAGAEATLAAADAGVEATYRWRIGETPIDEAARAVTHAFEAPGRHRVALTVRTPDGSRSCSATQVVHAPLAERPPTRSSSVVVDEARGAAFVVNPDAGTLSAVDLETLAVRFEVEVGAEPRTVAQAPDGALWVAAHGADAVAIVDPDDGAAVDTVGLRYGAAPWGVAFDPVTGIALVTLESTGQLAVVDPASRAIERVVDLDPTARVRGIAVAPDGARAYVTRFVSPVDHAQIYEVPLDGGGPVRILELAVDPGPDTADGGRGVPNYLSSIAITPDGGRAFVPGKKDNTERGLARDGEPLDADNTVRTIVSQLDLATGQERLEARIDLDDHDMATAVAFSPLGDLVFIASQGTNRVDVYDTWSGRLVGGIATGLAPQGLVVSEGRLYVQCFMGRTLDVIDVSGLIAGTDGAARSVASVRTVADEPLDEAVLLGKQIFYNADDPRMSIDGYLACASCHLDGGSDGRVWDFTDRGEGLRDTIDLRGRGGTAHGPVHWSGNFDEIQDFENDIRLHFGGSGLMAPADFEETRETLGAPKAGRSEALDALSAYVATLDTFPRSPHRNPDGTMTDAAVAGRAIFESLDCRSCHAGERLTDSEVGVRHDVGTIHEGSGQRLGAPLDGLDTPTLRGLWATAPYLHDGSAATLEEVLRDPMHGDASSLSDAEMDQLVAFLRELDNDELGYAVEEPPTPMTTGEGCGCRAGARGASTGAWLIGLALALVLGWRRRR
ncbi:MAG TPA: Ig-like domain-containing protein [Sandaracinaceae bacterium LLY-WYZ-13_1]|nr:Ig-like domain-containing protein [Sandaracinaceae bacterium LLY-WYZ-13_1]